MRRALLTSIICASGASIWQCPINSEFYRTTRKSSNPGLVETPSGPAWKNADFCWFFWCAKFAKPVGVCGLMKYCIFSENLPDPDGLQPARMGQIRLPLDLDFELFFPRTPRKSELFLSRVAPKNELFFPVWIPNLRYVVANMRILSQPQFH